MMHWNNDMMGWMGWGGGIGMIFFWIIIIVLVVFLVKWLTSQSKRGFEKKESPMDILKRRYARGEIEKAEFEEKKNDLEV